MMLSSSRGLEAWTPSVWILIRWDHRLPSRSRHARTDSAIAKESAPYAQRSTCPAGSPQSWHWIRPDLPRGGTQAVVWTVMAPDGTPESSLCRVFLNGKPVFVYASEVADVVLASAEGDVDVDIVRAQPFKSVRVRPLARGVAAQVADGRVRFTVRAPAKLSVEFDGVHHPVFLLLQGPERTLECGVAPEYIFSAGKHYEIGEVALRSGETVHIEAGAVVHGAFLARDAAGVSISGRGVLLGGYMRADGHVPPSIRAVGCRDFSVQGITLLDGRAWHVVPTQSVGVVVDDCNIVSGAGVADGVDVVSCRDVTIRGCFIRTKDDCIAVKADGSGVVCGVDVSQCVLWNAEWGNAMEIGYETRCAEISDIRFHDIDVIHCEFEGHQSGAVCSIHNGDRALVQRVSYDNIRVEDAREKLIDVKILHARYSQDRERGQVRGVRFRDVWVVDGPFPVSIIQGYDDAHLVEDVCFTGLTVHGRRVTTANEARMVVELARGVAFC